MKGLIFTYCLTYGGAVISIFKPFHGFLVYVCFALIKPEALWFWSVPAGNYSRIVAIAFLGSWLLHGAGGLRLGGTTKIVYCLLGFWLWSGVSGFFCADKVVALGFLESKAKIVFPFIAALTLIENKMQLRQLAWTITLSLGYVALEMNISYFEGSNRLLDVGFGGMDNNSFVIGVVAGIGLAFFLGLSENRWSLKLIAFLCAALMAHCVFFSFSRGGVLGLIVVGAVSFLVMPKKPSVVGLYLVGACLALAMAGDEVRHRFVSAFAEEGARDESAQSRLDLWVACVDIMKTRPFLGIGPDHFPIVAHEYGFSRGKEAHTLWLQIGAELGLPGMSFLVAFYAITAAFCYRTLKNSKAHDTTDYRLVVPQMVLASLAGFAVSAQFVGVEGLEVPYYITLIGAGAMKLEGLDDHAG